MTLLIFFALAVLIAAYLAHEFASAPMRDREERGAA